MKVFKKFTALILAIGIITVNCIAYAPAPMNHRIPINTPTRPVGDFSLSTLAIDDIVEIKGSKQFDQTGKGAYYYAYSGESRVYSEAFANIKLPSVNNANGTRNAFIALGIAGNGAGMDLGLINKGSGWMPVYNEVANETGYGEIMDKYISPSNATNAIIVVKPVDTKTVHMYIQFKNSSGQNVGKTYDEDIPLVYNSFSSSGGRVSCRFYRFASLVPNNKQDNQNDGSYMRGGQFTNLGLYNRNTSSYDTWGINTARVTDAWKVSPERMSLSYGSNYDNFSINHSNT